MSTWFEKQSARNEASKAQKAKAKAAKRELEAKASSEKLASFGRVIASEYFAGKNIKIYDKGFVSLGLFKEGQPEKLLGIAGTSSGKNKNGIGRTAVALVTVGTNLLWSSSRKGDAYLNIVTDVTTHSLHVPSPSEGDFRSILKLEAAGQAIIDSPVQQVAKASSEKTRAKKVGKSSSLADDLEKLSQLRKSGSLTATEYASAKKKLLS